MFRLDKDEAVINRYGFNSEGVKSVLRNLRLFENRRCDYNPGLLGVNVGACLLPLKPNENYTLFMIALLVKGKTKPRKLFGLKLCRIAPKSII